MKIRTGFVSNSSSSSYVVLITPDDLEKVLSQMDAFGRAIAEQYLNLKKVHHFGLDLISFSWSSGNIDSFEDVNFGKLKQLMGEEYDSTSDAAYEAREQFCTLAKNSGAFLNASYS